jgi:hypothetical protein
MRSSFVRDSANDFKKIKEREFFSKRYVSTKYQLKYDTEPPFPH